MTRIQRFVRIKGTPQSVFRALTTTEGLSAWWTRKCSVEGAVGGRSEFHFRRGEVVFGMRIEALEPGRLVRWFCVDNTLADWRDTTLRFEIADKGGEAEIHFIHEGWADENEWFEHSADGWDYFLKSLKDYVETGVGSPDAG